LAPFGPDPYGPQSVVTFYPKHGLVRGPIGKRCLKGRERLDRLLKTHREKIRKAATGSNH